VQTGVLHHRHHFGVLKQPIDPYVVPGDPSSGVLPRISTEPPGEYGQGDNKVQAYCFRMCLTDHPRTACRSQTRGYDPGQYELLLRIFDAGWRETFDKFDPIPNHKTDTNNHGPLSTDNIGMNYDYPEASYERRREIIREHETYQQGWLYFIANDPRVPEDVRREMSRWGLAKDEFTDNGHWPHQIYVREARRMIGRYVMTENELLKRRPTPESVGMGSYTIDSHNVQRYITPEGYVQNEGDIGVSTKALPDRLRVDPAPEGAVREPAGAGLRLQLAHRVRLDPHGAGVHDPGPVGGDRRSKTAKRCRTSSTSNCASVCWPTVSAGSSGGRRPGRRSRRKPAGSGGRRSAGRTDRPVGTQRVDRPLRRGRISARRNGSKGQLKARFEAKLAAGRYAVRVLRTDQQPRHQRPGRHPSCRRADRNDGEPEKSGRRGSALCRTGRLPFAGDRPAVVESATPTPKAT
jgi:hypothetical protein